MSPPFLPRRALALAILNGTAEDLLAASAPDFIERVVILFDV
jgi:hypothetical protein